MCVARPRLGGLAVDEGRLLAGRDLAAEVARQVAARARGRAGPSALGPSRRARSSASIAPVAVHQPQPQAPESLPGVGVLRRAARGALGGLGREVDRAHVLVDARGEAMRRRALVLDARPVAHRAAGRGQVAALPEGERHQPQHGGVLRLGVARVDQPLGGERVVALGHRVLGGGHEALDALGARIGLAEVDELQRPGGHRAHAGLEAHARPLLDVVAVAREVDPAHRADAPLGVGQAARVAVHDRVIGHARAERVVDGAVAGCGAGALLGLVGAPSLLLARGACGRRADLDGVARDPPAARGLGDPLELVGGLVDRLQVALVRDLLAGRREVRMPDLGLAAAGQLDVALLERRRRAPEGAAPARHRGSSPRFRGYRQRPGWRSACAGTGAKSPTRRAL